MKKLFVLLLALFTVLSLSACNKNNKNNIPEGYYATVDLTSREKMITSLHKIVSTGTTKYTYKECWEKLEYIEEDPKNSNNIICIWTGKSMPKTSHTGNTQSHDTWNREHLFPKSHGFKDAGWSAHTDLHHLRATDSIVNRDHGDYDYGIVETIAYSDEWGNKSDSTKKVFEPRDEVKGDVARALMYMTIRYTGDKSTDNGVKLYLSNELTSTSQNTGYIGLLSVLLKWSEEDPVSAQEIRRNNRVYEVQGNRNPFIDNPEWITQIFGTSTNPIAQY